MVGVEPTSRYIFIVPSTYLFHLFLNQVADGKMQFWSKFWCQISKIRTAHLKTYSLISYQQLFVRKSCWQRLLVIKHMREPFLGLHLYLGAIVTQYALRYAFEQSSYNCQNRCIPIYWFYTKIKKNAIVLQKL